ncbi:MAG: CAF17-like 4Fe-4S cluster assembly/insertion protein YgfZ [Anaerolineae bacterium]
MPGEHYTAYRAACTTAAFADLSEHGWLRLTGRDRLDLLHRLSTNDLRKLGAGQGAPTVLTSAIGRVMALLLVYAGEQEAFVRTEPGQALGVVRYLNSMIFWQDEVSVADLSAETAQFGLYGPSATELLAGLTSASLDMPAYSWRSAMLAGIPVTLHRGGPLETQAWTVIAPRTAAREIHSVLAAAAAELDRGSVEVLRVEAGLSAWGHELSEQVTPLEAGLLSAISFNKGCYTGQEVIARQVNYDKITRHLVGLLLEEDAVGRVRAGAAVAGPGRGGFVGSVVVSPALDRPIALAVVPRELAQPDTQVRIIQKDGESVAVVTSLPFTLKR